MKHLALFLTTYSLMISTASAAASYDGYRWFQIEVSIFSNDFPEYRNSEFWSPDRLKLAYPQNSRELAEFSDFFQIEDFESIMFDVSPLESTTTDNDDPLARQQLAISQVGPFPAKPAGNMHLPDLDRESYLLLPGSLSDFQTTNERLERSPDNRLLFHGAWRQPVVGQNRATAIKIKGGNQYGQHHELEGSITLRFNESEDRVVIDTDLWLSEFTRDTVSQTWLLPLTRTPSANFNAAPQDSSSQQISSYNISRIVQMQQSRDMRSTEFHYLDHPSMALVVTVLPYDLPLAVSIDQGELSQAPAVDSSDNNGN